MPEKCRILVTDDEEHLRSVLVQELKNEGYDVEAAVDGSDAITMLSNGTYDLVLLDIRMPHVDGFEVLKFIKDEKPDVKVIMLTGFADLRNAIDSKRLGADDFVSKPYELSDLLTTIDRVISE